MPKIQRSKFINLNNYKYLYNEYITKKNSCAVIAKKNNCNSNSVRQALIYFNIPLRSIQDSLIINNDLIEIDDEIITAGLLGDGSLKKYNTKTSYPNFKKKNKYKNHILITAKSFYPKKYESYINKYNENYFTFETRVSPKLEPYYTLWYPNSTQKTIIPENIPITQKVLLNWFLDDGSSSYRKRNEKYKQKTFPVTIWLCTDSFNIESQEYFINRIYKEYKLTMKLITCSHNKNQKRIRIPTSESNKFFDIIGKCPVKELEYKWKFPYTIKQ